jgi:hypothetical protein
MDGKEQGKFDNSRPRCIEGHTAAVLLRYVARHGQANARTGAAGGAHLLPPIKGLEQLFGMRIRSADDGIADADA